MAKYPHVLTRAIDFISNVGMDAMMHGQFRTLAGNIFESTCKGVMKLLIDPHSRMCVANLPRWLISEKRIRESHKRVLRQEYNDTMITLNCLASSWILTSSYDNAEEAVLLAEVYYEMHQIYLSLDLGLEANLVHVQALYQRGLKADALRKATELDARMTNLKNPLILKLFCKFAPIYVNILDSAN